MNTGFVCLYDKDFNPLGNWTQHVASSWTLTRKAYEFDELSVTCRGYENSANACFIGLHEETGDVKYMAFCGIPTTKDHLTTIRGVDCRQIFNQEIVVDLTERNEDGSYVIDSVSALYTYLLQTSLAGMDLGVTYSIDVSDTAYLTWEESYLVRSSEVRDLYSVIQATNNAYDCYIETEVSVNTETNKYQLTFVVKRITESRNIKLSDYDVVMSLNQNLTNRAIARTLSGDGSGYYYETRFYLYNDNSVVNDTDSGFRLDLAKCLYPPKIETIEKEAETSSALEQADLDAEAHEEAKAEAQQILLNNRYKDKVTIDLNTKLGSTLEDVDLNYFLYVSEYNPADLDTVKKLPVFSIKEDSKGNRTLVLGRLSDYWFME